MRRRNGSAVLRAAVIAVWVIAALSVAPALAYTPAGYWTGTWTSTPTGQGGELNLTLFPGEQGGWAGRYNIYDTFAGNVGGPILGSSDGSNLHLTYYSGSYDYYLPFVFLMPADVGLTHTGDWVLYGDDDAVVDYGTCTLNRRTSYRLHVTAEASPGGTITPVNISWVEYYGDSPVYVVQADPGYAIDQLFVDDVPVGPLETYQFTRITTDRFLHATFRRLNAAELGLIPIITLLLLD